MKKLQKTGSLGILIAAAALLAAPAFAGLTTQDLAATKKPPVIDGKLDPGRMGRRLQDDGFQDVPAGLRQGPQPEDRGLFPLRRGQPLFRLPLLRHRAVQDQGLPLQAGRHVRGRFRRHRPRHLQHHAERLRLPGQSPGHPGRRDDGHQRQRLRRAGLRLVQQGRASTSRAIVVEYRIPLQSIRFPAGKTITMRLGFFRQFVRTSEVASAPADLSRQGQHHRPDPAHRRHRAEIQAGRRAPSGRHLQRQASRRRKAG